MFFARKCAGFYLLWVGCFCLSTVLQAQDSSADESDEPVSTMEVTEIRNAFKAIGLEKANLERAEDGRVTLTGDYENRNEVEAAFAVARKVVGLRRVAPTTPQHIKNRLNTFTDDFICTFNNSCGQPLALPADSSPPPVAASRLKVGKPQTFGLILGIGRFKNIPAEHNLPAAESDARHLYEALTSASGRAISKENIYLLLHEQAHSKAVHQTMGVLERSAQPGDTVVVFVASHGTPNALGKYDIVLYDTAFPPARTVSKTKTSGDSAEEWPLTDRSTTLSDEDFEAFISHLMAKQVRTIVVMDTCYSGKTFASIPGYLPSRTRSLKQYNREVRYVTGPTSEAIAALALDKNAAKTTRVVIASASEHEEALDGMFTPLYIDSLNQQHDYADAFDLTKVKVIKRARTQAHSQTPRMLVVPEEALTKM